MHANPDLIRLLTALANASIFAPQRPILDAAITELTEWRRAREARDPVPNIPIQMFNTDGVAIGVHMIPLDVLRAAYRVHDYLHAQPDMQQIAGVALHKVNKG